MATEEPELLIPHLDWEISAAIGSTISAWAHFEYDIDELIWELARLEPEHGACLTAQFQTVAARFNALIALARTQNVKDKDIERINAIRQRGDALAQKRNRLVHDPWFYGWDTKASYRLQKTAKAKLIYRYDAVTKDEIKDIENAIETLHREFLDIRTEILHAFWSLS
jgi:hypothetical protein